MFIKFDLIAAAKVKNEPGVAQTYHCLALNSNALLIHCTTERRYIKLLLTFPTNSYCSSWF